MYPEGAESTTTQYGLQFGVQESVFATSVLSLSYSSLASLNDMSDYSHTQLSCIQSPLITLLIFLSAIVSYLHIFLLRIFVKPVMIATSVFIPATLFISAVWAFVGSFMWDADKEPTWGETVG